MFTSPVVRSFVAIVFLLFDCSRRRCAESQRRVRASRGSERQAKGRAGGGGGGGAYLFLFPFVIIMTEVHYSFIV